jgi:hypothetical protein
MPAAVFEALLAFCYDGHTKVEVAHLPELLQAAARLQMDRLTGICETLVAERITPDNALGAWRLGDMHTRPILVEAAKTATLASFAAAVECEDFVQLPAAWLEELLTSDRLVVKDEADVFRALKRWHAAQQPAPDQPAVARLLECVRWAHLDKAFVVEHVNPDPLVTANAMIMATAFQQMAFGVVPRKRIGTGIECTFSSPFDTNGVLYHIATNGGKEPYANPHASGKVSVTVSHLTIGSPYRFVERGTTPMRSTPTTCQIHGWPSTWAKGDRSAPITTACAMTGMTHTFCAIGSCRARTTAIRGRCCDRMPTILPSTAQWVLLRGLSKTTTPSVISESCRRT